MSEHRGHKQDEIKDIDDVDHDFSNLPDCILHHILSLIPTKEAVKTSILSTRWKNLYASLPNIGIDDLSLYVTKIDGRYPSKVASFMNFAERVFGLRGALKLEKLSVKYFGALDSSMIHSLISDAITHNVQELDLCFFSQNPPVIPWNLFHSTSLASLKINTRVFKLPPHISFPCLKTLHLSSVTFPDSDSLQKLLSGIRVLEELVLSCCQWRSPRFIVISSSTLKSLRIYDPLYFGHIHIYAANLICFKYTGYMSNKILLHNASSLVEVCIHIDVFPKWKIEAACRVVELLKELKYVVSLRVSNWTIECLKFAENMPILFPGFRNLIHLTLTTEVRNYASGALVDLLSFCPVLQSICFSEGFIQNVHLHEDDSIWSPIPICMNKCFKRLTLKKFHGYNSEICFLKCVLKYAHVLEKMDIWWSYVGDLKRKIEAMKELETIERSSTACVIKFS